MIGSKARVGGLVVAVALLGGTAWSQDRKSEALSTDGTAPTLEVVSPRPGSTIGAAKRVEVVVKATDEAGVASVLVNGAKASKRADGTYAFPVEVRVGVNKVSVTAQDTSENSASVTIQFRCAPPPEVKGSLEIFFKGKVDDPKARVTVNDKVVTVKPDGSFECPVVPDANGKITVVAVDEFGNETRQVHDLRK